MELTRVELIIHRINGLVTKKIDTGGFALMRNLKILLEDEIESNLRNLLREVSNENLLLIIITTDLDKDLNSLISNLVELTNGNLRQNQSHKNNQKQLKEESFQGNDLDNNLITDLRDVDQIPIFLFDLGGLSRLNLNTYKHNHICSDKSSLK